MRTALCVSVTNTYYRTWQLTLWGRTEYLFFFFVATPHRQTDRLGSCQTTDWLCQRTSHYYWHAYSILGYWKGFGKGVENRESKDSTAHSTQYRNDMKMKFKMTSTVWENTNINTPQAFQSNHHLNDHNDVMQLRVKYIKYIYVNIDVF